jgi:DNA gyrase/topoisomerase IV subunit B
MGVTLKKNDLIADIASRSGLSKADDRRRIDGLVDTLMGRKAEKRFHYIRDHAPSVIAPLDI